MLNLLKELCSPIAVSGDEKRLSDLILSYITPYCDSVEVDAMGNIIAFKKGEVSGKRIMLAAHLDEVGFAVTNVLDNGLLCFSAVGGIDERIFVGKRVEIMHKDNIVSGVIGVVPVHLLDKADKKVVPTDSLYIDIGADSKDAALKLVSLGDCGVLSGEFEISGSDYVISRALDDRCGCSVLVSLIKSDLPLDCYFVFTVQEEIGCRGALAATYTVKPDYAIVIDSTTACDIEEIEPQKTVCNIGGGPVISFMDRGSIYSKELYALAFETAKKCGIKAQVKRAVAGANDSSAIHKSLGGVKTLAVSLPCRYIHSPSSVVSLSDLSETLRLTKELLNELTTL